MTSTAAGTFKKRIYCVPCTAIHIHKPRSSSEIIVNNAMYTKAEHEHKTFHKR